MISLSRQSFLCHDNILFIPQTCMSQHQHPCLNTVLMQLLQVGVVTKVLMHPSFSYRDSISILVLVATLSCIIVISVMTQKVCRDRVLSPLSLFPCCSFIFLWCDLDFCVGDVLHVATPIFYVATILFCMQHIFLSRLSLSGRDITCLPLACLRVVTHFLYRNRTFLCSADLCYYDPVCYVVTLLLCICVETSVAT